MRLAERVTAQITAYAAENDKPIRIIINSPGGHVESGDTIHDMIRFCGVEVKAIGTGWVASAGAHIFLGAKKENRLCLPNTRFLLHQPAGGMRGQASDIQIEAEQIIKMRDRVNRMIAKETGQKIERIVKDTQRNFWMNAEEAVEYGLVSRIINDATEVRPQLTSLPPRWRKGRGWWCEHIDDGSAQARTMTEPHAERPWWKGAVLYHVYVRSFFDSD